MTKKSKHGPHGPGCVCDDNFNYSGLVQEMRDLFSREMQRFIGKKLSEMNLKTEEEIANAKTRLADGLLVATALELSEGCVKNHMGIPESAEFFLGCYEQERNRILLANAKLVGVIPVVLNGEEEGRGPDPTAN